jgi:lysosomal alpha-mannosidase
MQKRVLNERPSYDVTIASGMNITANYYPVNSAIAIRDESKPNIQMTVLNSQTQGGSVLQEGRIELMQHRNTKTRDGRGMGEALRDLDENGQPISVEATYYV